MNVNDLLNELLPVLLSGIGVILSSLIGVGAHKLNQRFGLDIEARHREALHRALMSGIQAAIEDGPEEAAEVLVDQAVAYARDSVPDAIAKLSPTAAVLARLARGKLLEAAGRYNR